MIESIIIGYLINNKRIVIPELGAFIKKEADSSIVFVPFLTQDDGVLKTLIEKNYGVDNEEAGVVVKEYVELAKRHIGQHKQFVLKGIGVLKLDENEIIYLDSAQIVNQVKAQTTDNLARPTPTPTPVQPPKPTFSNNYREQMQAKTTPPHTRPVGTASNSAHSTQVTPAKGRSDMFIIVAIGAAVIALGALIYGYVSNKGGKLEQPTEQVEDVVVEE